MTTPTEAVQILVRQFAAEDVPVVVIAERLGVSRERVEEVLRESEVPVLSPEAAARADRLLDRLNAGGGRRSGWHAGGLLTKEQGAEMAAERAGWMAAETLTVLPPPQIAITHPEGAVAHLSLPLSVPALVPVLDALELAYGPDLSLSPAEGGVWVLRRAS